MEDHVSLPKKVRLTDSILKEAINEMAGQGLSCSLETEKYGLDHFFGMKPRLSKVVKESFC